MRSAPTAGFAHANKACQQYRKVLYLSADELFDRITIAERTGDKKRCLDALVKVELLIIDLCRYRDYAEGGAAAA